MNTAVKILYVLTAAVFLVSSVGISLHRNTCNRSGEVQVALYIHSSCCSNDSEASTAVETDGCQMDGNPSCAWEENHGKCCFDESSYFKTENRYSASEKVGLPDPNTGITNGSLTHAHSHGIQQAAYRRVHELSGGSTSKDLFSLHTLLLI